MRTQGVSDAKERKKDLQRMMIERKKQIQKRKRKSCDE